MNELLCKLKNNDSHIKNITIGSYFICEKDGAMIFCNWKNKNERIAIENALKVNSTLVKFNGRYIDICDVLLKGGLSSLQTLNISGDYIGNEGAIIIANALNVTHLNVKHLNISYNKIGDTGACAIAKSLFNSKCKIQKLNIDNNEIGNKGAIAISNALRSTKSTIVKLYISRNNIGNQGIIAIANALRSNVSLKKLDISINYKEIDGYFAIINVLKNTSRTSIQKLYCHNDFFQKQINKLLKQNKQQVQNEFYTFILCWKASQRDDIYPLNTIPKDVVFPLICEYLSS